MRDRSISLVALLLAGLAGCGEVDNGVCAGEQDDMVECTVDLCNANGAQWAHIPDDGRCGGGERCDPTAGCVAAGGLNGHAFLYAHDDHSGITVSVDGLEGVTATTDAMGAWSFSGLPTGTYTVTYTMPKYVTLTQSGVGVNAGAATSPPEVTLHHGSELGVDQQINADAHYGSDDDYNAVFLTPDKNHAVVRYGRSTIGAGAEYRAYNLGALSSAPVPLMKDPTFDPNCFFTCGFGFPIHVTNTHFVWTVQNQTVWSRPLDGGPPVILGTVVGNESLSVMGTPGPYVVLRKIRNNGVFSESSLYSVKVDGSTPMGTPAWVQPDAQHALAWVHNNDDTALFGVSNSTASPPSDGQANTPLHRIDLATNAMTNVNTGFATNGTAALSVSPDRSYVFGYLHQFAPNSWVRGFLIPISGTAGPALAPDYGAAATMYSDYASGTPVWFSDSSGVVYSTNPYGAIEGQLKVWATDRTTSTTLVAANGYGGAWSVHNKVVVYRDSNAATAPLRVVSAHSASPVSYPLDVQGSYIQDIVFDDAQGSSYMVWTQSVSSASATRAKIYSTLIPDPLVAAPTTVQLGGSLAAACQYEATLSDRTYWQLCQDTGTLSGFSQSTTAAATTTTMVRPGLINLRDGDSVGFRKYDGKLYTSPNTGTLSDVRLISNMWDGIASMRTYGNWVLLNDNVGGYLRASNVNGTGIDEPMTGCQFLTRPPYIQSIWTNPVSDAASTTVLIPGLLCDNGNVGDFQVPTANLP